MTSRFEVIHYDGTKSLHKSIGAASKAAKKRLGEYMETEDGFCVWPVDHRTVGVAVSSYGELTDEQSFIVRMG